MFLAFRRNPDGSADVQPADAEKLKKFVHDDVFKLGEVWFNEGEENIVVKGPER